MTLSNDGYPKLLSLAVHELRTPASVVGGYLRMLQRDVETPLSGRQLKMVEEAEKSCARLVELIAELSDLSKLDAGLVTLVRKPLDLVSLVAEVASNVHEGEDRDVRLKLRGDSAGAPVTGDEARLRGALHTIFRAILREQPTAGTVVVDLRLDDSGSTKAAMIVVAEASRVQAAYSEPAGPFDETRGGLGLALPIARRVIEAHGGRLSAPIPPEGPDTLSGRGAAIVSLPLRS